MRYFLYEEQGEGCDYTIGCGKRLREIEGVENLVYACLKVIAEDPDGEFYLNVNDGNFSTPIRRAQVLEVFDIKEIDLEKLKQHRQFRLRDQQEQEIIDNEKAEYERLKKKFES